MTDLTTITLEEAEDGVALVTLNRPDRLNAITSTMIDELDRVVVAVDLDPTLRAVVLTGAGRGFCAGLDLMAQGHAPGRPAGFPRKRANYVGKGSDGTGG